MFRLFSLLCRPDVSTFSNRATGAPETNRTRRRTCLGTAEYTTKILNGSQDLTRLLTLEALYIDRLNPTLNNRDEYRQRPLTFKVLRLR